MVLEQSGEGASSCAGQHMCCQLFQIEMSVSIWSLGCNIDSGFMRKETHGGGIG